MIKLFVGNLPFSATGADLDGFFLAQGFTVKNIQIISDRDTKKSRGFAFVEVEDGHADELIEQCHDQQFMGRRMQVNVARPREEREKTNRR